MTGLIERYQKMPSSNAETEIEKFADYLTSSLQDVVNPFDGSYVGAAAVESADFDFSKFQDGTDNYRAVAIGIGGLKSDGSAIFPSEDTGVKGCIFVEIYTGY